MNRTHKNMFKWTLGYGVTFFCMWLFEESVQDIMASDYEGGNSLMLVRFACIAGAIAIGCVAAFWFRVTYQQDDEVQQDTERKEET